MMKRLKYVSRFAKPLSREEIEALVVQAARKNKKYDITGILMTSGGMFFQIIEGPAESIDKLYSEIVADKRHTDVLLLGVEDRVKGRLFPDWSMKKVDLDLQSDIRAEPLKAILQAIVQQREIVERLTGALERAVWHELRGVGEETP
jgi:hypothetical protein